MLAALLAKVDADSRLAPVDNPKASTAVTLSPAPVRSARGT